jgi:hypothetical protein
VEYQSKAEHLDEFQNLRDDRRRNAILAAGYFPLAARYEDLLHGGDVLVGGDPTNRSPPSRFLANLRHRSGSRPGS